jgi:hypothetical protein
VYGVDHQLECGIDNGTRLFRVEVLHQLHRALDIGEESGDHLALTIEILISMQPSEALDERRCRRRDRISHCGIRSQSASALSTEVRVGGINGLARGATMLQPGAALHTKERVGGIIVFALRALHL